MKGLTAALALIVLLAPPTPSRAQETSPFMPVGLVTTQPIGHFDYCQSFPDDCRPLQPTDAARVSKDRFPEVADVAHRVNAEIRPASDRRLWKKEEVWSLPKEGRGDCEDYALLKRKRLVERGIAASDLLMTVVRRSNGEGHAVLVVRMEDGDYVLDNLIEGPVRWDRTSYRFVKRQSDLDPGLWVSIGVDTQAYASVAGSPVATASAR